MQDLLNILQHIKDQAEPTLTQSVYERHPIMMVIEIAVGILFVALIITLVMSVLGKWDDVPVEVYFWCGSRNRDSNAYAQKLSVRDD